MHFAQVDQLLQWTTDRHNQLCAMNQELQQQLVMEKENAAAKLEDANAQMQGTIEQVYGEKAAAQAAEKSPIAGDAEAQKMKAVSDAAEHGHSIV